MSVEQRLRGVLEFVLGTEPNDLNSDAKIVDDFGADSLEQVELLMAVEEEFGIEISSDEWVKVQTFGEIVTLVEGSL